VKFSYQYLLVKIIIAISIIIYIVINYNKLTLYKKLYAKYGILLII